MTHEMAKWILDHNGDCPDVLCEECLKGVCQDNWDSARLAYQWLAAHPETLAKPVDPRRYEIARAVMAEFAKTGDWRESELAGKCAVEWADALIADLDKEVAKNDEIALS